MCDRIVNDFIKIYSCIKENNLKNLLHSEFFCVNVYIRAGVWLSLVERFVRDEEVACSNLVTPTI